GADSDAALLGCRAERLAQSMGVFSQRRGLLVDLLGEGGDVGGGEVMGCFDPEERSGTDAGGGPLVLVGHLLRAQFHVAVELAGLRLWDGGGVLGPGALVEYCPADDHQVEHGAVESCAAGGSAQSVMQLAHGHRLAGVPPCSPESGGDVSVPGSEVGGPEQQVALA